MIHFIETLSLRLNQFPQRCAVRVSNYESAADD